LRLLDHRLRARGYAWLTDDAGRAIASSRSVAPGQAIHAVLADGEISARVVDVKASPH
jgi:exonuclease VII large subunit